MLLLLQGTFELYFDMVWSKSYDLKKVVATNHPSELSLGFGVNGTESVYLVELKSKMNPGMAKDVRYVLMQAKDILKKGREEVSNFY